MSYHFCHITIITLISNISTEHFLQVQVWQSKIMFLFKPDLSTTCNKTKLQNQTADMSWTSENKTKQNRLYTKRFFGMKLNWY